MPSTVKIEPKTLLTFMMQQLKRLEFITQLKITQRYFIHCAICYICSCQCYIIHRYSIIKKRWMITP
jgi:hypothetical protein